MTKVYMLRCTEHHRDAQPNGKHVTSTHYVLRESKREALAEMTTKKRAGYEVTLMSVTLSKMPIKQLICACFNRELPEPLAEYEVLKQVAPVQRPVQRQAHPPQQPLLP